MHFPVVYPTMHFPGMPYLEMKTVITHCVGGTNLDLRKADVSLYTEQKCYGES